MLNQRKPRTFIPTKITYYNYGILLNHAFRVYHANVYCYFFIQELDLAILEDLAEKVRTCTV